MYTIDKNLHAFKTLLGTRDKMKGTHLMLSCTPIVLMSVGHLPQFGICFRWFRDQFESKIIHISTNIWSISMIYGPKELELSSELRYAAG
jgi:hypothetical protein